MLDNNFMVEMAESIYTELGYEYDLVKTLSDSLMDRLSSELFRSSEGLTNEMVHCRNLLS